MTRSHGDISDMTYRVILDKPDFARIFSIMREQRLLWAAWPEIAQDDWNEDIFCNRLTLPGMYAIEGYIGANPAGFMVLWPFMQPSMCAEIGVTAYRPYFRLAGQLFIEALIFVLNNLNPAPASFIGRIAAPNRHIFNMYSGVGFRMLGNVPGMMWYGRRKKFVDAALVVATPETIYAARR